MPCLPKHPGIGLQPWTEPAPPGPEAPLILHRLSWGPAPTQTSKSPQGAHPAPSGIWVPSICHHAQEWFSVICAFVSACRLPATQFAWGWHHSCPAAGKDECTPPCQSPEYQCLGRLDQRKHAHISSLQLSALHPVTYLQKVSALEGIRVGLPPQGHNLPQPGAEGPPVEPEGASEGLHWVYGTLSTPDIIP